MRRITKGSEQYIVSIRTTQDCWIAFPRNADDTGWETLDDVDYVVAVTVDDKDSPNRMVAFMVPGDEMRDRFDRAYQARLFAGHVIPVGRGVWVSMFINEDPGAPRTVGGGIALDREPLLSVSLKGERDVERKSKTVPTRVPEPAPLTIAEAKRRLAETFGVEPEKVKIVIEA